MRIPLQISVILTLLVSAIWFCGCRRSPEREALERAEAVMEERPDSALAIVGALRLDSAAPAADRALHALLLVQAMHKNDLLNEPDSALLARSDSLTAFAADYYDREYNRTRLMKSLYYSGTVKYMNPDSLSAALLPLHESLELAEEMDDPFWTGRNYELMGDICHRAGAYRDHAMMRREALDNYRKTGREDYIRYAEYSMASSFLGTRDYSAAIDSADIIRRKALSTSHLDIYAAATSVMIQAYFQTDRHGESLREIERLDSMGLHNPETDVIHVLSYILMGNTRRADELVTGYAGEMSERDMAVCHMALSQIEGNPEGELLAMRKIYEDDDRRSHSRESLDLNTVHTEAMKKDSARRERHLAWTVTRLVVGVSGIVLVAVVVAFLYIRTRKSYKLERMRTVGQEKKYKELEAEKSKLEEKNSELEADYAEMGKSLRKELEARKGHIPVSRMSDHLKKLVSFKRHTMAAAKSDSDKALDMINREIDSFRPGMDGLRMWERILDEHMDNVMARLKEDVVDLSEVNRAIAIYLLLDLDNGTIGYMIGKSDPQTRKQILDLRKSIRRLPVEKRAGYMRILTKKEREGGEI